MLVVIVVAAATAFSFFVAAYQKQVQAQETLSHDRALEKVKVLGVSEIACSSPSVTCAAPHSPSDSFANVSFLITNLDVNRISVSGLLLDKLAVVNFTVQHANGSFLTPCYDSTAGTSVTCAAFSILPDSSVRVYLNLNGELSHSRAQFPYAFGLPYDSLTPQSDMNLQILTTLNNLFTETFAPPAAIISVFFVSTGGSSVPVFDGLGSYQFPGGNNASILGYEWYTNETGGPAQTAGTYASTVIQPGSVPIPETETATIEFTNGGGSSWNGSSGSFAGLANAGTATGIFGTPKVSAVDFGPCASSFCLDLNVTFTVPYTVESAGSVEIAATSFTYTDTNAMSWTGDYVGVTTPASPASVNPTPTSTETATVEFTTAGAAYESGSGSIAGLSFGGTAVGSAGSTTVGTVTFPSAGYVDVTFTFPYTATTPGSLTVTGASFSYDNPNVAFSGAEFEPQYTIASGTAVKLVVTDSDGLSGQTSIVYSAPA